MKKKIYVLAGSRQEFDRFCTNNYFEHEDAFYVYDARLLMGSHDSAAALIVIGTFWERNDAADLYKFASQMLHIVPPARFIKQHEK